MNKRDTKIFLMRLCEPLINNKGLSDTQVYQNVKNVTDVLVKSGDIDKEATQVFLDFISIRNTPAIVKQTQPVRKQTVSDPCSGGSSGRSPC